MLGMVGFQGSLPPDNVVIVVENCDAAAGSGHGGCSVWAGTKSSGPGRDARRQGRGWATGGAAPAAARRQGQLATAKALARGY